MVLLKCLKILIRFTETSFRFLLCLNMCQFLLIGHFQGSHWNSNTFRVILRSKKIQWYRNLACIIRYLRAVSMTFGLFYLLSRWYEIILANLEIFGFSVEYAILCRISRWLFLLYDRLDSESYRPSKVQKTAEMALNLYYTVFRTFSGRNDLESGRS